MVVHSNFIKAVKKVFSFEKAGLQFFIKSTPTSFRSRNEELKKLIKQDIDDRIEKLNTKKSCERFFEGEIEVELTFCFHDRYSIKDVDNIGKFIIDCMAGKYFKNDNQIKEVCFRKIKIPKGSSNYIGVNIRKSH
jgi:Holliday junction resolvase RusA-like endonuclease